MGSTYCIYKWTFSMIPIPTTRFMQDFCWNYFYIGICSTTTPKIILQEKPICLFQWYLPSFAHTHAKFERVEALLKGQACNLKLATLKKNSQYNLNDMVIGKAKIS